MTFVVYTFNSRNLVHMNQNAHHCASNLVGFCEAQVQRDKFQALINRSHRMCLVVDQANK